TIAELAEAFAVREAMDAAREHCRQLLDRFFCRDESYATIGSALDLPAGTIASRISRCLAGLRKFLEGKKPAPSAVQCTWPSTTKRGSASSSAGYRLRP